MLSTLLVPSVCKQNLKFLGAPQGHHNVHTGFVTMSYSSEIWKLQTDKQRHTENMAMLKFGIQKAFLPCIILFILPYCPSVCLSLSSVAPADWKSRNMTSYIGRPPKHRRLQFNNISDNNMAETRICKSVATRASLTSVKSITVYGPWNIIHCSQFSCGMYNLYSICAVNVLWCCAAEHVAAASVQLL